MIENAYLDKLFSNNKNPFPYIGEGVEAPLGTVRILLMCRVEMVVRVWQWIDLSLIYDIRGSMIWYRYM
jgi:hypothetical protein